MTMRGEQLYPMQTGWKMMRWTMHSGPVHLLPMGQAMELFAVPLEPLMWSAMKFRTGSLNIRPGWCTGANPGPWTSPSVIYSGHLLSFTQRAGLITTGWLVRMFIKNLDPSGPCLTQKHSSIRTPTWGSTGTILQIPMTTEGYIPIAVCRTIGFTFYLKADRVKTTTGSPTRSPASE